MASKSESSAAGSNGTPVSVGGFVPYNRIQPDWQQILEEKIASLQTNNNSSSSNDSKQPQTSVDGSSVSSESKSAISNGSTKPQHKFWVSSFVHDHRSVFDDAIITNLILHPSTPTVDFATTTTQSTSTTTTPATATSSSTATTIGGVSGTIRVAERGLTIILESRYHLWAHCELTHATSYIYGPLRSLSTLHTAASPISGSKYPRDRVIPSEVFTIDVSPSGDLCASGSGKGSAVVWHAATGKLIRYSS
jgi:hypothetical protein